MLSSVLRSIADEFAPAVLASSLSAEDMVLTHAIASARLPIGVFILDTGRLHADTLNLVGEVRERYGLEIKVYQPDKKGVDEYVARHGRDAFYGSLELRKRCCEIRKVEPLGRALAGKRAWITGLRRAQSALRTEIAVEEIDEARGRKLASPRARARIRGHGPQFCGGREATERLAHGVQSAVKLTRVSRREP